LAVGEAKVELRERGDPSWVLAPTFEFSKVDWQSCRKARGTPSMVMSDTGKGQSVTRTDQTEAEVLRAFGLIDAWLVETAIISVDLNPKFGIKDSYHCLNIARYNRLQFR